MTATQLQSNEKAAQLGFSIGETDLESFHLCYLSIYALFSLQYSKFYLSIEMNQKSSQKEPSLRKTPTPEYLESDLNVLENYFIHHRAYCSSILSELFGKQSNVYLYALDLMYYSKDFYRGKLNSLSQFIIENLKQWCFKQDVSHLLSLEIKKLAVQRALLQSNGSFVQFVCDVYNVKEDYDIFKSQIRFVLKEKKFKEAYYLITSLNAERDFTLEEFVFPVFFLDKEPWVKEYLSKVPEWQVPFVQTLDSICQNSLDIQEFVRSLPYESLPIRKHAYDYTRLQKLLFNYVEYFDIDIKQCKKLYHVRCSNALSYIIRKRYKEESISQEAFEEIVKVILDGNYTLQRDFLMKLTCHGENATAVKIATAFNIQRDQWPEMLQSAFLYDSASNQTETSTNYYGDYLKLRLDKSDIVFVDTPERCIEIIDDIIVNYNVVGIDAEWRPNLGITKENLSLYQIAVWDTVYLLDVLALKKHPNQSSWKYIIDKLFKNKNIIKLGYGIKHDLQHLLSLSDEKIDLSKIPGILDFCEFFNKIDKSYPAVMTTLKETYYDNPCFVATKGLSQLCATTLGKPLNKDEQFSDWERRPLRESQVIYAALDAYCLLLVYERLYHVLQDLNLNFEEVIKKTLTQSAKLEKDNKSKEKKTQDTKKEKIQSDYKPVPVSQFKVVVDNMLHGLGKYLRLCGADVVFLDNNEDHMEAVKISHAENRIILSAGTPYDKLSGYVSEDMCFCVPVSENAREQALIILQHFNVQCKSSDIFSRCSICSGNNFKKVPKSDLYPLWSAMVERTDTGSGKDETRTNFPVKEQFFHEKGLLENGVPIQITALSSRVFETVELFLICVNCGKVYWEGCHYTHAKKFFVHLTDDTDDLGTNIYKDPGPVKECPVQNSSCSLTRENESKDKTESVSTNITPKRNFMSFDVDDSSEDDDIDDIVICE